MALRRYADGPCPYPGNDNYHQAWFDLGRAKAVRDPLTRLFLPGMPTPPDSDPRWPRQCPCGYVFADKDEHQVFESLLYRRRDTGELITLRDAPPGAMWNADWLLDGIDFSKPDEGRPWPWWPGPDGMCLTVRLPDRSDWVIDSRSANCTLKQDNYHFCWVRHGTPPLLTVDKNGPTCQAGAGSIQSSHWHGFLRNGVLEP